ncbi:MAG TPA: toll/interleukin-1 receptor domain-containing protein [Acidimicrobiales bacterium]|nr:toll/interleukin-1 receptor domain-containing protein [Acidimicrobiales bacterium]
MSGIFLSYRRADSAYAAGRLRDDLADHYGDGLVVFRDVEAMPLGPFPAALAGAVRDCSAMLVLIGAGWLAAANPSGRRRLDDPDDWVRREVAAALAQGKVVVPVLVEGAALPGAADLPADLAGLALQQAVELPDSRWDYEVGRLVERLDPVLGIEDGARVHTGPWSGPDAPVRLTVERVEAGPDRLRFHLAVDNATADGIELAPDWFDVTDDTGHAYPPVPPWEPWPMSFDPGTSGRGCITVGEGLRAGATHLTVGWGRALGTYEVGSLYATVDLGRRRPGRDRPG